MSIDFNKPIKRPSRIFLLVLIPIISYFIFVAFFGGNINTIIVFFLIFLGSLAISILGYIFLKIRKHTTIREAILGILFIIFLFLLVFSIYKYYTWGTLHFVTLEKLEKMNYDLPIDNGREALAYAKEAKYYYSPVTVHNFEGQIISKREGGHYRLVDWLTCDTRAFEGECDLEKAKKNPLRKRIWWAWVKQYKDIWLIRISSGRLTECTTRNVYIYFNEKGNFGEDLDKERKYYDWWAYKISDKFEFIDRRAEACDIAY